MFYRLLTVNKVVCSIQLLSVLQSKAFKPSTGHVKNVTLSGTLVHLDPNCNSLNTRIFHKASCDLKHKLNMYHVTNTVY